MQRYVQLSIRFRAVTLICGDYSISVVCLANVRDFGTVDPLPRALPVIVVYTACRSSPLGVSQMSNSAIFGITRINRAILFATEAHKHQVRKGNTHVPYVFHPIDVAHEVILYSRLCEKELELATVIALLHDTVEDTSVTLRDILEHFDEVIMRGVDHLTILPERGRASVSKDHELRRHLERLQKAPDYVQVVKLADRISNLRVFPAFWGRDKIREYLDGSALIATMLGHASEDLHARLLSRVSIMRTTLSIVPA